MGVHAAVGELERQVEGDRPGLAEGEARREPREEALEDEREGGERWHLPVERDGLAARRGGRMWTNGPGSTPRASAWSWTASGPSRARSAAGGSAASAPSVPIPQRSSVSARSGGGS